MNYKGEFIINVRRIDDLGRIVIPKEIRKSLMWSEGESIQFNIKNKKLVLSKHEVLCIYCNQSINTDNNDTYLCDECKNILKQYKLK